MINNYTKIKIAQVVGNAKTGGVMSCVMNFFRHVDHDKFQFDFYTYGPSPYDDEIRSFGSKIFYIPNVLNYFKSRRVMKKFFKTNNYDIVHAHLTTLSFIPLKVAKQVGVKIRICHAHSTSHRSEKTWLIKNVLKHISKIYPTHLAGCSRCACNWLYGSKSGAKAFILHNAIDVNRFNFNNDKAENIRIKYGLVGKKIVGHIGRIEFQKNPLFIIDIFNEISKKIDNAVFIMVGDGSMKERVTIKINKYGLKDKIFILDEMKNVEDYYLMFDVFILPSKFEGLPLVAIEAQMIGLQCLLSDSITRETDISGHCQFLPIKDAELWCNQIISKLNENKKVVPATVSDYDILYQVKKLEQYYENIYKNMNN